MSQETQTPSAQKGFKGADSRPRVSTCLQGPDGHTKETPTHAVVGNHPDSAAERARAYAPGCPF